MNTRLSKVAARLLVGVLAVSAAGLTAGTAAASPVRAQADELMDVTIGQLHPTQSVLGFDEIYYKLGRYGSTKDEDAGDANKRFDDWCETNGQEKADTVSEGASLDDPSSFSCTVAVGDETADTLAEMKKVVIGPGGTLYLTDGHHTMTTFLETPDGGAGMHIRVRVAADLSDLSPAAFWQEMQAKNWVWLRDANNGPITVDQLPDSLGLANFTNDPYRGLVFFTRDIGYAVPANAPEFLEFYWGSWLRTSVDVGDYDLTDLDSYLDLVKKSSKAMAALDKGDVVENGATADELGKMADWNDGEKESKGEFGKLGKPLSDEKPGKLAYAIDYRSTLAPACHQHVALSAR